MLTDVLVAVSAILALSAVVTIVWDTVAVLVSRRRRRRQEHQALRAQFDAALRHLDDARRSRARERA
jgi:cytochrome c-type biogenesis protein CcmH/NrfF